MEMTTTEKEQKIEALLLRIAKGAQASMQGWVDVGQAVTEMVALDPDAYDRIIARIPWLTERTLARLELIGKKELLPDLVVLDGPGPQRLAKLPYLFQEKYIKEPIDLLIRSDKDPSGWEILKVDVRALSTEQSHQVFSQHGVRPAGEQRAWIEDRDARAARKNPGQAQGQGSTWKAHGSEIVISGPMRLRRSDLIRMMAELENR